MIRMAWDTQQIGRSSGSLLHHPTSPSAYLAISAHIPALTSYAPHARKLPEHNLYLQVKRANFQQQRINEGQTPCLLTTSLSIPDY